MNLRSGVVLQGAYPPREFRSMVERIDAMGFSHLWLTDSSLHARNSYAYLTLAATASPRLLLGTAVTNPLTRHPAITAVAAATVDEISEGRMILGIGAGDRPLLALGMKPARLASVRVAIESIRALWSGVEVTVEDPAFALHDAHLRFEARHDIPVYISASGPKTLELAGEVADGVILLVGLFPEALAWALDHVDRGAAKAGRARPHVAVFAYGAIDDDESRALGSARSIAAWFPQTAPVICELGGLPTSLIDEVRGRYQGGEFQEAADAANLLPDEFVRKVALAGNAHQARERLEAVAAAGADSVHVFPLGEHRMQTIGSFAACFADVMDGAAR
ncbi:MAG TPA: LLM class flavin-dependent oxidoreductase [Actinomycetota bacterium]